MNDLAPAIYTENLTRRFGDLTAVDRLNLIVPRGVIFGFLVSCSLNYATN